MPTDSRWSIYTSQKPKISTVSILDRNWKDYVWLRWGYQQLSRNEKIAALFNINGANELLDNSVIKYVIVPIQDFANDDDFFIHYGGRENPNIRQWYIDQLDQLPYLKKIDIGTQELVVYENEGYKPYITTSPDLATITNLSSLDDKYSYVTNQLSQEFLFTETVKDEQGNNSQTILPSTFFQSIYEDLTPDNITADKIRVTIKPPFANNSLYANNAWQDLPARDEHVFEYDLPEGMGMNIIPNASLENGLWPAPPTKCLDHDRTGLLQSRVDEDIASEGDKSLLVKSTSETACAGLGPLPVKATSSYLLSFDYQADNENVAGYRLDFDQGKDVDELLPAPVSDWQKFNQLITIPHNATNLTLFVYSYADEDNRYKTVRYDNFRLMQIPDLHDKFYFVSTTGKQLQNPAKVDFEIIMPTKKLARIKSATTPFYLNMSESYHDQWRLMMDNDKVRGKLASWVPWAVPDAIANEHHYKLNSFLNGWYVDTNELCVRQNLCRQNADGSYDMDMVIEFWPQRWFYLGLIISGATLVGCLGYLSYAGGRVIFKKYFS
ncbi:MAG: hypothetical protein U1C49_00320 [Candidatus Andersenbacteria bacterium]|nr:hypothetical protein [Candidatus Andersenbacteria bacterium]